MNEEDYKTLSDFFKKQVGIDMKFFDKMKECFHMLINYDLEQPTKKFNKVQ